MTNGDTFKIQRLCTRGALWWKHEEWANLGFTIGRTHHVRYYESLGRAKTAIAILSRSPEWTFVE